MTSEEGDMEQLLDSALLDFDALPQPKVTKKKKKPSRKPEPHNPTEEDFLRIFESASQGAGGLQQELEKLNGLAEGNLVCTLYSHR